MKRFLLLLILFAFISAMAFSYDFGLLTDQRFEADNESSVYYPILVPWFSWDGGEGISVYLSGIFTVMYWNSPVFIPEFSRFALRYRLEDDSFFEVGRVSFSDSLGMTAFGFFDGIKAETSIPAGSLKTAFLFTGLLYKETAQIMMTENDAFNFVDNNYFASNRFFANIRYDMPLLDYYTLSLETLFQFDLNGSDDYLYSQYGMAMMEFFPENKAGVAVGALLEVMERKDEVNAAFGALARLRMTIPGSFDSGIRVTCKFTSGNFTPINSPAMGLIFSETISGLALISADYTTRIKSDLLTNALVQYFFRTSNDPLLDGRVYGCEIQASIAWQPFDDLRASFGGGLFLPGMGNVYSDTQAIWKIKASLTMSF